MPGDEWTLDPDAEREILLPWRAQARDPEIEALVLEYLARLLRNPFRPALEDRDSGVYSLEAVPETDVGLGWTLKLATREVVLFHVG